MAVGGLLLIILWIICGLILCFCNTMGGIKKTLCNTKFIDKLLKCFTDTRGKAERNFIKMLGKIKKGFNNTIQYVNKGFTWTKDHFFSSNEIQPDQELGDMSGVNTDGNIGTYGGESVPTSSPHNEIQNSFQGLSSTIQQTQSPSCDGPLPPPPAYSNLELRPSYSVQKPKS